jgi:hypothetical protein
MTDPEIAPWIAVLVIVFTVWRAFQGPYSDRSRSLWHSRLPW